ncbi:MAG TPA: hypothetical protein VGK63_11655, partial [Candidatus Limnocylindrales bacterium]
MGGLGYCGLDRRRSPLRGTELRGCWQPAASGRTSLFDAATTGGGGAAGAHGAPPGAEARGDNPPTNRHGIEWVVLIDDRG